MLHDKSCSISVIVLYSYFPLSFQLSNYSSFEGVLYCKPHFDQLFKMTGSLDKSFEGDKLLLILLGIFIPWSYLHSTLKPNSKLFSVSFIFSVGAPKTVRDRSADQVIILCIHILIIVFFHGYIQ